MARKRINVKKIREILRFKETSDMSDRKIARALNISRPVVAQYVSDFKATGLTYQDIKEMPDSRFLAMFENQRSQKSSKYEEISELFPYFVTELKRTGVTLMILWEGYRIEHPDGYSYSQFCYHFQVWRNASKVTMGRGADHAKYLIICKKSSKNSRFLVLCIPFRVQNCRPKDFC